MEMTIAGEHILFTLTRHIEKTFLANQKIFEWQNRCLLRKLAEPFDFPGDDKKGHPEIIVYQTRITLKFYSTLLQTKKICFAVPALLNPLKIAI